MRIQAIGIDAAFSNMGFAKVYLDLTPAGVEVSCLDLHLCTTQVEDKKVVRKSSDDLRRAKELQLTMIAQCEGAVFAFAEIPSGSQSASAARSLGIAVGILASCPVPIIEVSPMEVKKIIPGFKGKEKVTKAAIITWARKTWPEAPWLMAKTRGVTRATAANEHLADALAAVMAGIQTPQFKNAVEMMRAIPNPDPVRPASSRRPLLRL